MLQWFYISLGCTFVPATSVIVLEYSYEEYQS